MEELNMDERLKREVEDESPRTRAGAANRRSRELDDRAVTEDRVLSDDERVEMFRQTMYNDVLPDLPNLSGYHVCWLSTSHPNDTIPRRIRLGYEMIKAHEVPGMEYASIKTGEQYAGGIAINEMVAFKLPLNLYQRYMHIEHHDRPNEQVESIRTDIDSLKERIASKGGAVEEEDGMADVRSTPSRGRFE